MTSRPIDPADIAQRIGPDRFEFTFARSGGAGGQNVNKVSTRVTLWFDLSIDEEFTAAEKRRIRGKLGGRIGGDDRLRVVSSKHRTQQRNREAAIERFYEIVAEALTVQPPRRKTRVPKGAKRRRLEDKRARSEKKQQRRPPDW